MFEVRKELDKDSSCLSIFVNDTLHLKIDLPDLKCIRSWYISFEQNPDPYFIELTFSTTKVICQYDSVDKWRAILRALGKESIVDNTFSDKWDYWEEYNKLMNKLREEVARRAKEKLPNLCDNYYFKEWEHTTFPISKSNGESTCMGLIYNNKEVKILCDDGDGNQYELSLINENIETIDLIFILDRI